MTTDCSCPRCHHYHNGVLQPVHRHPTVHSSIVCRNCHLKLFGLGGTSFHSSLLSQETLQSPDDTRWPRNVFQCHNGRPSPSPSPQMSPLVSPSYSLPALPRESTNPNFERTAAVTPKPDRKGPQSIGPELTSNPFALQRSPKTVKQHTTARRLGKIGGPRLVRSSIRKLRRIFDYRLQVRLTRREDQSHLRPPIDDGECLPHEAQPVIIEGDSKCQSPWRPRMLETAGQDSNTSVPLNKTRPSYRATHEGTINADAPHIPSGMPCLDHSSRFERILAIRRQKTREARKRACACQKQCLCQEQTWSNRASIASQSHLHDLNHVENHRRRASATQRHSRSSGFSVPSSLFLSGMGSQMFDGTARSSFSSVKSNQQRRRSSSLLVGLSTTNANDISNAPRSPLSLSPGSSRWPDNDPETTERPEQPPRRTFSSFSNVPTSASRVEALGLEPVSRRPLSKIVSHDPDRDRSVSTTENQTPFLRGRVSDTAVNDPSLPGSPF